MFWGSGGPFNTTHVRNETKSDDLVFSCGWDSGGSLKTSHVLFVIYDLPALFTLGSGHYRYEHLAVYYSLRSIRTLVSSGK